MAGSGFFLGTTSPAKIRMLEAACGRMRTSTILLTARSLDVLHTAMCRPAVTASPAFLLPKLGLKLTRHCLREGGLQLAAHDSLDCEDPALNRREPLQLRLGFASSPSGSLACHWDAFPACHWDMLRFPEKHAFQQQQLPPPPPTHTHTQPASLPPRERGRHNICTWARFVAFQSEDSELCLNDSKGMKGHWAFGESMTHSQGGGCLTAEALSLLQSSP